MGEQEKLKELLVTEKPVEASEVMMQIKESKAERKKHVGHNKKHVSNINEIIETTIKQPKNAKRKCQKKTRRKRRNKCVREGNGERAIRMMQFLLLPTTCLVRRTTKKRWKPRGTLRWSSSR